MTAELTENQHLRQLLRRVHNAIDNANAREGNATRLCLICGSTGYDPVQGIVHRGSLEHPGCVVLSIRKVLQESPND